jgi:hypothetical protein
MLTKQEYVHFIVLNILCIHMYYIKMITFYYIYILGKIDSAIFIFMLWKCTRTPLI